MKNIKTFATYVIGGTLLYYVGKRIGYMHGVMDVLSKNDIDSFTREYKHGYSLTISKKKGEDK